MKFRDPTRETSAHSTVGVARTNVKRTSIPFYVLIILITFFPLTAGLSDVLQEKVARDILTVPVGGSVTIRCKEHAKYMGSLE